MESLAARPFQWPIAAYLTLAGVAAGAAMVGAWRIAATGPDTARLGRSALLLALVTISVGGVCLIVDLEGPSRFWMILAHANPTSVIAWGARILTLFALTAGFAWLLEATRRADEPVTGGSRLLLGLVGVVALALAVYPAFVLRQAAAARPLWSDPVLVPLFTLSGLHAGLASVAFLPGGSDALERPAVRRLDGLLLVGLAILLPLFTLDSVPLLGLALGVGVLLPLLSLVTRRGSPPLRALLVLVGSFALRGWVVLVGQTVR
ncbi:MAG: NrfD/PsrC family molybdoenzyme membrane anchor subunit [Planctomycetota bacterium JB042]